jgi:hypothetical protein
MFYHSARALLTPGDEAGDAPHTRAPAQRPARRARACSIHTIPVTGGVCGGRERLLGSVCCEVSRHGLLDVSGKIPEGQSDCSNIYRTHSIIERTHSILGKIREFSVQGSDRYRGIPQVRGLYD